MKNLDHFSKRFLAISVGIAVVFAALSLFMFSVQSTFASQSDEGQLTTYEEVLQSGTAENFIPLGIEDGYGYWVIFNTKDGYKFRRTPISGGHWGTRTE